MRREMLFGTVMAAALAIGASAQSTSPSSGQSQSDKSGRREPVTGTGCLVSADSSGGGTAGGSTAGGTTAGGTASGASGTSGTSTIASTANQAALGLE